MTTGISGLFGDMKSSEDYRRSSIKDLMVTPGQMGSQGLYQQLISQMSNAGANIGSIAGGMMGGKTSEQVRDDSITKAMQEVSQEKHETESDKLQSLANKLQEMGLTTESQKALDRANSLQMNSLNIQKAQKDLEQPEYKDFTSIRMVKNPLTEQLEPKQFKETRRLQPDGSYRAENGAAGTTEDPRGTALNGPRQERINRDEAAASNQ